MHRLLYFLPLLFFVSLPDIAQAQLVSCTGVSIPGTNEVACGTCEFASTVKNVIQFLIVIFSIVATIILVYVGLRLVTSGGNPEAQTKAKEALRNILIGFLLVIAAFAIVDAVMRALLPIGSVLLNWQEVECLYAIEPDPSISPTGGLGTNGTADLPPVSGVDLCNQDYLGTYFPGEEEIAQCVLQGESACGAYFYSTTDYNRTADGQKVPFSVSPWQINLTVHEIREGECASGPIDCKAAYDGKNYSAVLVNENIYAQCVAALQDPACSGALATRIQEAGWTQWSAYTDKSCN